MEVYNLILYVCFDLEFPRRLISHLTLIYRLRLVLDYKTIVEHVLTSYSQVLIEGPQN